MATRHTNQPRVGILAGLLRDTRLVWRLMTDRRVSLLAKLGIPLLAGIYLFSPIDIMPDILPVLGQMDDLAILALAVKMIIELAPPGVVKQYRDELARAYERVKPGTADETIDAEYRVID